MVTGETDPTAFEGTLLIGWDGERVHWIAADAHGISDHGVDSEIGSLTELSRRFASATAVKLSLLRPVCSLMPAAVAEGIESQVLDLHHGPHDQALTSRTFFSDRLGEGLALIESGHFGSDDLFLKAFPLGQWSSSTLAAIESGMNEVRTGPHAHTVHIDLAQGRALMMRFDAEALRWCSVTEDVAGDGILYHVVNSFHREGVDPTAANCRVVFSGGITEDSPIVQQFKRFFAAVELNAAHAELGESGLLMHLAK